MKLKSVLFVSVFAIAGVASAQISFTGSYSQNFDTLATSGTTNSLSTLTGFSAWQAGGTAAAGAVTNYRAGDGSANTGALYSYGTGTATDRALGSVSSGTPGTLYYGFTLVNNTSDTFSDFVLGYTGEQWRTGGSANTNLSVAQKLTFSYLFGATSVTAATNYTAVSALDFTSPKFGTTAAAALNGNLTENRQTLSSVIAGLTLAPGESVTFRFADVNDANNDHGFGIDDLRVTARAQAVPEPATMAALGLGAAAMLRRRRKA